MLTAQLAEIRRDLAQFPSAALQRACTAVDDARSLELECIAPGNSTRRDHRQDQAALTVLAWKHGVQGTCTRQVVPLIVHVEGAKMPCAGSV